MANTAQVLALGKLATAFEDFTKAAKSDAAKELRKECEALEAAHGGAKKLAQADKAIADARAEAEGILAAARHEADGIKHDAIDEINDRKGDLDLRDAALGGKIETNDSREQRLTKDEAAVKDREVSATAREQAVKVLEDNAASEAKRLAAWETALDARDRDLEAWAARMQSASAA